MNLQEKIKKAFQEGMTYGDYRVHTLNMLEEYHESGKEDLMHYTKMNEQRMHRLDKRIELTDAAANSVNESCSTKWLVITEPWCGDAAQLVPLFNLLAQAGEKVEIKHILRDANPEIMDHFEVNGSRAIPIIVFLDDEYNVLAQWGARPAEAQEIVNQWKNQDPKPPYSELTTQLQKWYNKDKTATSQLELQKKLASLKCVETV